MNVEWKKVIQKRETHFLWENQVPNIYLKTIVLKHNMWKALMWKLGKKSEHSSKNKKWTHSSILNGKYIYIYIFSV